jgi:hypothetical protein
MVRWLLGLVVFAAFTGHAAPYGPGAPRAALPDPSRARPLDRWPDAADIARLQSVEGRRTAVVLRVLGHPSRVTRRSNGEEVWDYPWCAACRVWVRDGVCTGTFCAADY